MRKTQSTMIKLIKHLFGKKTGTYFIDSTSVPVCKVQRILIHKIFKDIVERGMTLMGWFYGFKIHFIINDKKEIINFKITKGNSPDNASILDLVKEGEIKDKGGKLIGDRGYISKEEVKEELRNKHNIEPVTKSRKNMKNKQEDTPAEEDKRLSGRRGIIETVIGEIKRLTNLE